MAASTTLLDDRADGRVAILGVICVLALALGPLTLRRRTD